MPEEFKSDLEIIALGLLSDELKKNGSTGLFTEDFEDDELIPKIIELLPDEEQQKKGRALIKAIDKELDNRKKARDIYVSENTNNADILKAIAGIRLKGILDRDFGAITRQIQYKHKLSEEEALGKLQEVIENFVTTPDAYKDSLSETEHKRASVNLLYYISVTDGFEEKPVDETYITDKLKRHLEEQYTIEGKSIRDAIYHESLRIDKEMTPEEKRMNTPLSYGYIGSVETKLISEEDICRKTVETQKDYIISKIKEYLIDDHNLYDCLTKLNEKLKENSSNTRSKDLDNALKIIVEDFAENLEEYTTDLDELDSALIRLKVLRAPIYDIKDNRDDLATSIILGDRFLQANARRRNDLSELAEVPNLRNNPMFLEEFRIYVQDEQQRFYREFRMSEKQFMESFIDDISRSKNALDTIQNLGIKYSNANGYPHNDVKKYIKGKIHEYLQTPERERKNKYGETGSLKFELAIWKLLRDCHNRYLMDYLKGDDIIERHNELLPDNKAIRMEGQDPVSFTIKTMNNICCNRDNKAILNKKIQALEMQLLGISPTSAIQTHSEEENNQNRRNQQQTAKKAKKKKRFSLFG